MPLGGAIGDLDLGAEGFLQAVLHIGIEVLGAGFEVLVEGLEYGADVFAGGEHPELLGFSAGNFLDVMASSPAPRSALLGQVIRVVDIADANPPSRAGAVIGVASSQQASGEPFLEPGSVGRVRIAGVALEESEGPHTRRPRNVRKLAEHGQEDAACRAR